MSGVYLHATSAVMAILRSGKFKGTCKQMQTTGASADKFRDDELHTLFVEWQKDDVTHSVSRLGPPKRDVRGVLVFRDPNGRIVRPNQGYPQLSGREVPLSDLSLRMLITAEEDLQTLNLLYSRDISLLIRSFVGNMFGFYPETLDDLKKGARVKECLAEGMAKGCFY